MLGAGGLMLGAGGVCERIRGNALLRVGARGSDSGDVWRHAGAGHFEVGARRARLLFDKHQRPGVIRLEDFEGMSGRGSSNVADCACRTKLLLRDATFSWTSRYEFRMFRAT